MNQHQQRVPPVVGRKTYVKTCPSCGQRMAGYHLGSVHVVRECKLFLRSQRKANAERKGADSLRSPTHDENLRLLDASLDRPAAPAGTVGGVVGGD